MYHNSAHLFCIYKEPTTYQILTSVNRSHISAKPKFPQNLSLAKSCFFFLTKLSLLFVSISGVVEPDIFA